MIVNKYTELKDLAKLSYNDLCNTGSIKSINITDLIFILEDLFRCKWEYRNSYNWNDIRFSSYLIDQQIAFNKGEDIDLTSIYNSILYKYDFTSKEKRIMTDGNIEERIWSVFKYCSEKIHKEYKWCSSN